MSEKWHYITYSEGTEELYDMEKDPMEWKNLAGEKSPEFAAVKAHLRTFLPANEVDSLPQSKGKKGNDDAAEPKKGAGKKAPDPTIKPRRILTELK